MRRGCGEFTHTWLTSSLYFFEKVYCPSLEMFEACPNFGGAQQLLVFIQVTLEKGLAPKASWKVEGLKSMAGKRSWLNLKDDKVMKDDLKMTLI
jgi:hypothetical protein